VESSFAKVVITSFSYSCI